LRVSLHDADAVANHEPAVGLFRHRAKKVWARASERQIANVSSNVVIPILFGLRVAPSDNDLVDNAIPGIVNADEEQQQRCGANDKEHLAGVRPSRECR